MPEIPENKVTFGLEQLHFAFRKASEVTPPEYDPPVAVPGAVQITTTPQGQKSTFYADNGPYWQTESNNGYTGELRMANVPNSIKAEALGWEVDSNGMLIEVANAKPKHFALMCQIEGDARNRRVVYWDCVLGRPSETRNTKGETVTPDPDVLPITILPIKIGNKPVVKGIMELGDTNAAAYNAFFESVPVPTTGGV